MPDQTHIGNETPSLRHIKAGVDLLCILGMTKEQAIEALHEEIHAYDECRSLKGWEPFEYPFYAWFRGKLKWYGIIEAEWMEHFQGA